MTRYFIVLALTLLVACNVESPTEPVPSARTVIEGCGVHSSWCIGNAPSPLNLDEVYILQVEANAWVDKQGVAGPHVYPEVVWHTCTFTVDKTCMVSWTESKNKIHVATSHGHIESLVLHETIHARYCQSGDCDYNHLKKYKWDTLLF